jgi:hypothetical protein
MASPRRRRGAACAPARRRARRSGSRGCSGSVRGLRGARRRARPSSARGGGGSRRPAAGPPRHHLLYHLRLGHAGSDSSVPPPARYSSPNSATPPPQAFDAHDWRVARRGFGHLVEQPLRGHHGHVDRQRGRLLRARPSALHAPRASSTCGAAARGKRKVHSPSARRGPPPPARRRVPLQQAQRQRHRPADWPRSFSEWAASRAGLRQGQQRLVAQDAEGGTSMRAATDSRQAYSSRSAPSWAAAAARPDAQVVVDWRHGGGSVVTASHSPAPAHRPVSNRRPAASRTAPAGAARPPARRLLARRGGRTDQSSRWLSLVSVTPSSLRASACRPPRAGPGSGPRSWCRRRRRR